MDYQRLNRKYSHNSFYGFYPSDVFDFGELKDEIIKMEKNSRSIEDLQELKKLYKKAMPESLDYDDIIRECEYSKEILNISLIDIENFSDNSQRTASELVSLLSLFAAVMALGATVSGLQMLSFFPLMFGVIATVGACISYRNAVNLRTFNSALIELYRNMIMSFETIKDLALEMKEQ